MKQTNFLLFLCIPLFSCAFATTLSSQNTLNGTWKYLTVGGNYVEIEWFQDEQTVYGLFNAGNTRHFIKGRREGNQVYTRELQINTDNNCRVVFEGESTLQDNGQLIGEKTSDGDCNYPVSTKLPIFLSKTQASPKPLPFQDPINANPANDVSGSWGDNFSEGDWVQIDDGVYYISISKGYRHYFKGKRQHNQIQGTMMLWRESDDCRMKFDITYTQISANRMDYSWTINSGDCNLTARSGVGTIVRKFSTPTRENVTQVPIHSPPPPPRPIVRYTPPPTPATKTVQLTLKGIFMSPCNEGVAGYVEVDLRDKTTGYTISSREGTRSIYKNPSYSLSCSSYDPGGYADHNDCAICDSAYPRRPETEGHNVQQTLSYMVDATKWNNKQYEFRIRFTLGSQHRDNFMASLGNHWLATGKNRIEERMSGMVFKQNTIGPYTTPTNRQHQYWLQFSTKVY